MNAPTVDHEQLQELSTELGGLLKETDPFWVRWLYLLHCQGILP